jgi:hypothetical protein
MKKPPPGAGAGRPPAKKGPPSQTDALRSAAMKAVGDEKSGVAAKRPPQKAPPKKAPAKKAAVGAAAVGAGAGSATASAATRPPRTPRSSLPTEDGGGSRMWMIAAGVIGGAFVIGVAILLLSSGSSNTKTSGDALNAGGTVKISTDVTTATTTKHVVKPPTKTSHTAPTTTGPTTSVAVTAPPASVTTPATTPATNATTPPITLAPKFLLVYTHDGFGNMSIKVKNSSPIVIFFQGSKPGSYSLSSTGSISLTGPVSGVISSGGSVTIKVVAPAVDPTPNSGLTVDGTVTVTGAGKTLATIPVVIQSD